MSDFKLLGCLSAVGTIVLGAAIYFGPANESVDYCPDEVNATYTVTGELFGDANSDGKLSGTECDWK